jgi:hypothetical protein
MMLSDSIKNMHGLLRVACRKFCRIVLQTSVADIHMATWLLTESNFLVTYSTNTIVKNLAVAVKPLAYENFKPNIKLLIHTVFDAMQCPVSGDVNITT